MRMMEWNVLWERVVAILVASVGRIITTSPMGRVGFVPSTKSPEWWMFSILNAIRQDVLLSQRMVFPEASLLDVLLIDCPG